MNLNETLKKVVVIFLIITLTYANLILIGSNIAKGLISYAADEEEESPTVETNQYILTNTVSEIEGEQKRIIQVIVETGIESEENPIKQSTLTLATDIIEGTLEDVTVTQINKNSYTSGTWAISEEKLIISLVNENETLESKDEGLDMFIITYVFSNTEPETIKKPVEKVEVETYAEETLVSEYEESYFETIDVQNDILALYIENSDIHKTTIADGQVEFTEDLILDVSYRKDTSTIIIEDESNNFYNIDAEQNEEVSLTYKTTTTNKEDLLVLLGEEGKLVITDTSENKIVAELTKETIEAQELDVAVEQTYALDEENNEVRSNVTVTDETIEIEYAIDVTKLKLELTNIQEQSESQIEHAKFIITNTKTISNINDVDSLDYLQENIIYTVDDVEKTLESTITFKDTITRATLEVDNTTWVVGEANTVNYTITLDTTTEKSELFVSPMFLIELPTSVESVNTANSQFTVNNDNGAFTSKSVFITTVMGRKFVVITLTGAQTEETIANGNTTIDLTLELNIAEDASQESETTKLYYQNSTVTAYESGNSFDTADVTVSLIMASESEGEVPEGEGSDDDTTGGTTGDGEDNPVETEGYSLAIYSTKHDDDILSPGDEYHYGICVVNFDMNELQNLQLTGILPEGITIEKVLEIVDEEETEIEYTFDETTREYTIDVGTIERNNIFNYYR